MRVLSWTRTTESSHLSLLLLGSFVTSLVLFCCCPVLADFSSAEVAAMQRAGVVPPVVSAMMKSHSEQGYFLAFAGAFIGVAVLWGMMQSGFTAWLSKVVQEKLATNSFIRTTVYVTALVSVYSLIRLPFAFYAGYSFPHSYGLSNQTVANWFADWAKSHAIEMVLISFVSWSIVQIIKRFPKRWVLTLWAGLTAFLVFSVLVEPLIVEPLFNKFTPMANGALRTDIESVAAKAGIPDAPIFVVDKSRQTKTINAYVTGIGSSARIVIWDNTLNRLPKEQILSVVAHETGHYALGHLYWGLLLSSGGVLLSLLCAERLAPVLLRRLPKRWGVTSVTDLAAIPVVLWGVAIMMFLTAPLDNGISRYMEHQADAFGLGITRNGPAMARAFVSLSEQNLSDPDPPAFVRFWLFSHPTLRERINFCLAEDSSQRSVRDR